MFDGRAFRSWTLILVGALMFAGLFMLVVVAADRVLAASLEGSRAVFSIGAVAFVGYIGAAWLIRQESAR